MAEDTTPATTPEKKAKAPAVIRLQASHDLLEPFNLIRFPSGVPVTVDKITGWMQSQIDAGLMIRIS
jgi:hypothetical protein